ncbi:coniferyl aldehyde dehydrogenase [Sinimarinibacterium sp. NLF-5-8]|uniref:coniferyl aldehyde dehydrogenase n=1 Tax=Sinimarinibacterium sp. NLF-5-8 TaxID=2698684 RepID=UPI00137BEBE8|nr:coniferyl aldehyde dehydrogenase [Sinimarinibacterium sp. NLF-5-8]QHS10293.1 coniferyl aldehyde dehydrogenase [Sinimarinibacterium sp. NLF-5-8]
MQALLDIQRRAFMAELPVPLDAREDRLRRLMGMLIDHRETLCAAIEADFGVRSRHVSMLTDIVCSVRSIRHSLKHLRRWMRPSRRALDFPLALLGGRAQVSYQPKGVVGVISPWNFPVYLGITPVAGALAAGNRVMLKPSELTPRTSEALATCISKAFREDEVAVVTGGTQTGIAFSQLAFDHLVFTGGGTIGREVMRAAATHLVPVTLELGGKSPVIVSKTANLEQAAERVILGKLLNAGQICLAPDYALVDRSIEAAFAECLLEKAQHFYPPTTTPRDYAAIVNARHHQRLMTYVDDARAAGATIDSAGPASPDTRVMPFTLIRGAPAEAPVMTQEIFGPLLPLVTYEHIDDAIAYINARDRPLGLYYFGTDKKEQTQLLERTLAGGVTVNDVIAHVMQESLPLGGIGPSGMGRYHGHEGFLEFSHAKAIYRQPTFDLAALLGSKPPYGDKLERYLRHELKQ